MNDTMNNDTLLHITSQLATVMAEVKALSDRFDEVMNNNIIDMKNRIEELDRHVDMLERFKQRAVGYALGAGLLGASAAKVLSSVGL